MNNPGVVRRVAEQDAPARFRHRANEPLPHRNALATQNPFDEAGAGGKLDAGSARKRILRREQALHSHSGKFIPTHFEYAGAQGSGAYDGGVYYALEKLVAPHALAHRRHETVHELEDDFPLLRVNLPLLVETKCPATPAHCAKPAAKQKYTTEYQRRDKHREK